MQRSCWYSLDSSHPVLSDKDPRVRVSVLFFASIFFSSSNAEATFVAGCKDHVGIHWIALTQYSQIRTHVSGFQSFFASIFLSSSNAEATFVVGYKDHVGIHWIALTQYSQIRTHVSGFQSFFASICIIQISHQQHKGGYVIWQIQCVCTVQFSFWIV